ncbi:hypothetical protein [Hymenobacter sp. IS2118]|uniref:hypothetical protein n=1 Tax=Hymenobacter sp. IS2118 TaxID=1505605 RepID=UPI00054DE3C8|nr:hypothetical protein [Hymenobacter sp. IS2118]
MSNLPELPESGRPNLCRALAALPNHEPDFELWPLIMNQLDAENGIQPAWPALPAHAPDDALWNAIAARLDAPATMDRIKNEELKIKNLTVDSSFLIPLKTVHRAEKRAKVRTLWPASRRLLALAASLLLLVGLVWWQRPAPVPGGLRDTVAYSQEILAEPVPGPAFPAPDPLEAEGRAFIDGKCSTLPAVCQSSEFQLLRDQLDELETEEAGLLRDTQRYGNRPEIVRHQVRVTARKATVTRELIRLLIS